MSAEQSKTLGNKCFKAKDFKGAVTHFTEAIKLDDSNETFYSNRSAAYLKLGEAEKAEADGKKCVELKADWAKGYARQGAALVALKKYSEAVAVFAAGMTKDPSNKLLLDGLQSAQKKMDNPGAESDDELGEKTNGTDTKTKKKNKRRRKKKNQKKNSEEEKQPEDVVIGIDLGTTNSCVGVWENNSVHIIENNLGDRTIPSYVSFDPETGKKSMGITAKNQATRFPLNTIYDVKRIIGQRSCDAGVEADYRRFPFQVNVSSDKKMHIEVDIKGDKVQYAPEQISAMVLTECKTVAENYLKKKVNKAVITVPAYFNDSQRNATKAAGKIAGLEVLRIINEPTAAALAYGLDRKDSEVKMAKNVLVFDLGGGTFDVSILSIEGGVFTVLATGGDTRLGGEDFDHAVVDFLVSEMQKEPEKYKNKNLEDNKRTMSRIRRAAEIAKIELSKSEETLISLDAICEDNDFQYTLTRTKFDQLNRSFFARTIETVKRVMKDAKLKTIDVSEIVMVGGSTRIPKVQSLLSEMFDRSVYQLCKSVNPDEAVAYGAAVQGAILNGQRSEKTNDILLMDVTPLSLGIETCGRVMSVIIPRNSAIPCIKTQTYTTEQNYQTQIDVSVYEGERLKSDENNLLGEFTISGIENAKRGEPQVDVSFSLDSDGILTVTAKDQKTGASAKTTISNRSRASDTDIAKMVEDAEKNRKEDEERIRNVEAKNQLEALIYDVFDVCADMKDDKIKKILEEAAQKDQAWLEENKDTAKTSEINLRRRTLDRRLGGKRVN